MASDLVIAHYGKTHMGAPIAFSYEDATFDCMENAGSRIRALRKAMGLNQKDLAKRIGIDQSTLSDIENGAGFGADKLMLFVKELGATAEFIMRGQDSLRWPFAVAIARYLALSERDQGYVERALEDAIAAKENADAGRIPAPDSEVFAPRVTSKAKRA